MLAPDYLDHAPDALVALWQEVEDTILRDVARRIGKMDALTPTANWQLWRYQQTEAVRKDVVKLLARYTGKSEAEIRRLMQEAATAALEAEDEIYYHYGKEPTPFEESAPLQNLLNAGYRQTAGSFSNLTATTANTVSGAFEQALDRAWLQVSSGAFDYKTAVKRAVDGLADSMPYVTYPSGQPPGRAHRCESDWLKAAGGPDGRVWGLFCRGNCPRRSAPQSCRVAGQALPPGRGCGLLGPALRRFRVGHRLRHRRRALRLELPPHLLRGVPGAGQPARMDAGKP